MKKIPYVIHEAAMQRLRDALRRMYIALLLVLGLLIVSNMVWALR